ncbi:MAG: multicopper oxidase family protein [Lysobacter sp.]
MSTESERAHDAQGSTPQKQDRSRRWKVASTAGALALVLGSAGAVAYVIDARNAASLAEHEQVDNPTIATIHRDSDAVDAGDMQVQSVSTADGHVPVLNHEARLTLDIAYTDSKIFNPSTNRFDHVRLRSYRSPGTTPSVPFVAPTISVSPGETVRVTLNNKLPDEGNCMPANINTPHCFNSTNLHAHGLWVSPSGNSDNVMLTVRPGVSFEYEYNIPADHPAGTYWYHPHLHGSTALQVSSGMAGALIIRGSRLPTPQRSGDIDTLLRNRNGKPFTERVMLLQQVQYACRDAAGKIKTQLGVDGKPVAWVCDEGDVGTLEAYDQFGSFNWVQSNRHTSVNGRVLPTFTGAKAGQVERWRTIHAGVRNSVKLQFRKLRPNAPKMGRLRVDQQARWIGQNCTGDVLPHWEIASDGLTHRQAIQKQTTMLHPGYRSDALLVFPEAGDYCVIDAAAPLEASVGLGESRQLLGKVRVDGGTRVRGDLAQHLSATLLDAAEQFMPRHSVNQITAGLSNGLRLDSFAPHADVRDEEVTGTQSMTFDFAGTPSMFLVDGESYNPHTSRNLVLGDVEEWMLTSNFSGHPFHIHVNPFQIVRILDPDGKDVSVTGEPTDAQYANLKGTWKDTIFLKQDYKVYVRTRYQRYIGDFVLHCHILDHEDVGMMQNVRVVLPDGKGGAMTARHH